MGRGEGGVREGVGAQSPVNTFFPKCCVGC